LRQRWDKYNTGAGTRDQIDYTYDYAGNRLTRINALQASRNQTYTYDRLHRLKSNNEPGTANDQSWELDQLGNWVALFPNANGSGIPAETRTHNSANELETISTIPNNLAHDLAGNMTTIPRSLGGGPSASYLATYDAWNRLVEVKKGVTVVQTNEYDGLNRRIVKTVGTDVYDYYYNQQWQVLEIRKNGNANPWKQYVYNPEYVDSIAVRYYDENTNGNAVEHYYLQDANFNVTAVVDNVGAVVERYAYSPYGEVTVLDANFIPTKVSGDYDCDGDVDGDDVLAWQKGDVIRLCSAIDNELLYTGRRRDPETGLQLNRNRFYASHLGRWINRDPIGYDGDTANLYEYVHGGPDGYTDPFGETVSFGIRPIAPKPRLVAPKPRLNLPRAKPSSGGRGGRGGQKGRGQGKQKGERGRQRKNPNKNKPKKKDDQNKCVTPPEDDGDWWPFQWPHIEPYYDPDLPSTWPPGHSPMA